MSHDMETHSVARPAVTVASVESISWFLSPVRYYLLYLSCLGMFCLKFSVKDNQTFQKRF